MALPLALFAVSVLKLLFWEFEIQISKWDTLHYSFYQRRKILSSKVFGGSCNITIKQKIGPDHVPGIIDPGNIHIIQPRSSVASGSHDRQPLRMTTYSTSARTTKGDVERVNLRKPLMQNPNLLKLIPGPTYTLNQSQWNVSFGSFPPFDPKKFINEEDRTLQVSMISFSPQFGSLHKPTLTALG
nr:LOW QUALITY PROTEIN: membrane-spanning 4-domains subfamily A member 18-like [Equus asinus]